MKLKEDGFVIDTSSERAIKKKRIGVPLDTFSLPENKGKFVETVGDEEGDKSGKDKKKKAPAKKKDKKGGGGGGDIEEESREGFSREMETYKTIRQNSLYSIFIKSYKLYK